MPKSRGTKGTFLFGCSWSNTIGKLSCSLALVPGSNFLPCAHLSVEDGALQTVMKSLTRVGGAKMGFHLQPV